MAETDADLVRRSSVEVAGEDGGITNTDFAGLLDQYDFKGLQRGQDSFHGDEHPIKHMLNQIGRYCQ